jgi:hypothetical protein
MNTAEFIGLKSARDLLGFIEKVYSDFCQAPTETQLITLIFSLNHMRDWISGGQTWDKIKKVDKVKRNSGQILYGDIHDIPEFINVLNPLCNGLKHFSISLVTEPISGARSGLLRVGDSLSQQYFTINGIDSRNIFYKILEKYRDYFATSKC